ncbi:MAG: ABC transporter transmembrane domain-containing protein, partial [bacterium]
MNKNNTLQTILEIRERSIFNFFNSKEITSLSKKARIVELKNGDVFVTQGEQTKELAILLSGKAHLFNKLHDGKEFLAGEVKQFRSIDLSAMLVNTPWHYSAQMDSEGKVLYVSTKELLTLLKKNKKDFEYLKIMTTDSNIQDFVRPIKYEKGVNIKDIKDFVLSFKTQNFNENEIIQKENTTQTTIFLLKEGVISTEQFNDASQKENILSTQDTPSLFGHQHVENSSKKHISIYTFRAISNVELYKIPIKNYLKLLKQYPFIKPVYDGTEKKPADPEIKKAENKKHEKIQEKIIEEDDTFDYEKDVKTNKKFPIIKQHDKMDCAAACMAMISKYFGIDMGVAFFRNSIDVGSEGASLYGISSSAERIGLLTRGVKVELKDIFDLKLPAICIQGYHFVVVYDVTKKHVIIADPAIGLRKISHAEFKSKWNNVLLLFNTTTDFYKNESKPSNLDIYWDLFKPYKGILVQILVISLLLNLLGLATPYFSQQIIDKVLLNMDFGLLNIIGAGFLIFIIMSSISGLVRRYLTAFLSLKMDIELSSQLFRHLFRLPASFFASRKTGDTLMRINDIHIIKNFISQQGIEFIIDVLMSIIYVLAIFSLNLKLGFVFVSAIAVLAVCTIIASKFIYRYYSETISKSAESQTLLVEGIKNINTLKIFSAEIPWRWKWEDKYAQASMWQLKMRHVNNFYSLIVELFYKGIPLLVLYMGAKMVISDTMTIGTIIALMALFAIALGPILSISNIFMTLQEVRFGIDRLNDIFSTKPEDKLEKYLPISADSVTGRISFKNVHFKYGNDESPEILKDITTDIKAGQLVAIMGRSGSGKTTMVQLINRLFEPSNGKILIDGYDVKHYPLSELRRIIAMVTQDSRLFSGTIIDNISIGDQFPDIKKVINASVLAGADSFIRQHPDGYFRQIMEDGCGLSSGQKQRVTIARALYRNPKILIMDEATSSLDAESETAINEAMPNICKDRTVILVAHKLSSIKNC